MLNIKSVVAALVALFVVSPASATVVNFSDLVPADTEQSFGNELFIDTPDGQLRVAGSDVHITGVENGIVRGLGQCSDVAADGTCATADDRAINIPVLNVVAEGIFFEFPDGSNTGGGGFSASSNTFDVTSIAFRDIDGNSLNDSDAILNVAAFNDGGLFFPSIFQEFSFAEFIAFVLAGELIDIQGVTFGSDFELGVDFFIESIGFNENLSAVPLPAALPLFLAGIGGIGFISRNKKKEILQ